MARCFLPTLSGRDLTYKAEPGMISETADSRPARGDDARPEQPARAALMRSVTWPVEAEDSGQFDESVPGHPDGSPQPRRLHGTLMWPQRACVANGTVAQLPGDGPNRDRS